MDLSSKEKEALESLVGTFDTKALENLMANIDHYIHPKLSVFVPRFNYCHYAVMPNHAHTSYSFIFYYDVKNESGLRVNGEEVLVPYSVKEPMYAAIAPGVVHQEVIHEGYSSYYAVFIDTEFYESIFEKYGNGLKPEFTFQFYKSDEQIIHLLKLFMVESDQNYECKDEVLEGLAVQLTHRIIRNMLQSTSIDLTEVALECGFSGSSYFSQCFLEATKETPSLYRKKFNL